MATNQSWAAPTELWPPHAVLPLNSNSSVSITRPVTVDALQCFTMKSDIDSQDRELKTFRVQILIVREQKKNPPSRVRPISDYHSSVDYKED